VADASAHVAAGVSHARAHRGAKLGSHKPHTRRAPLTFQKGALVVDTTTGQIGVIVRGKKAHVPTATSA